MMKFVYYKMQQ